MLFGRLGMSRVRRSGQPGHHEPPGEEETGLHPRADGDRGEIRGGPADRPGGTPSPPPPSLPCLVVLIIPICGLIVCVGACMFIWLLFLLCLRPGVPQAHVRVRSND